MPLLYGYILAWKGYDKSEEAPGFREQFREKMLVTDDFSSDSRGHHNPNNAWESYWLSSTVALHDHGPDAVQKGTPNQTNSAVRNEPYTYSFRVRVNSASGTIIIVSTLYSITDAVIENFNSENSPNLQRQVVDIHKVSQELLSEERDRDYSITYFLADIPGYGSSLRSITLYGNDIAEADFLRSERKNFSARKIGVRPFNGPYEAGRFNNQGTIQFRSENIGIFEEFLRYAYKNDFYIE
jgi:hypothetical protein